MMAVLAAFGYAQVEVFRKPRVAVLATGSELVAVDQKPGQDQIRDSNNYSISAYAELAGAVVERMPLTGDETSLLKNQLAEAAKRCDLIVTSGGVSMGVYDVTKAALKELDAEIFFERVALRPGKPTVFARLPNGTLVFGLPGNPVSVSVTFNLFARTALLAMQGTTEPALKRETAVLARSVKGTTDRESYLPAQLTTNDDGGAGGVSVEVGWLVRLCGVCVNDRVVDRSRKRQSDRSRIVGECCPITVTVGRPSVAAQR